MNKFWYGAGALIVILAFAYALLSPGEDEQQEQASAEVNQRTPQAGTAAGEEEPLAARSSQRTNTAGKEPKSKTEAETKAEAEQAAAKLVRNLAVQANTPKSLQQHLDKLGLTLEDVPIQSPARPYGMDIIAPALDTADDKRRTSFVSKALPEINAFLEDSFKDRPNIDANSENLTLEDLLLEETANVRVYFIKEGTVFHNTLGMVRDDTDQIIFPDASSRRSYFRDAETRDEFTSPEVPLMPGDYVDLGVMQKGELLDFFLIKDGARIEQANQEGNQQGNQEVDEPTQEKKEPDIYWVDPESNADKSHHVKYHGMYDENIMIIGFEDLPGGGDRDFNDLVIAVELTAP
jgi:hypothetical protein